MLHSRGPTAASVPHYPPPVVMQPNGQVSVDMSKAPNIKKVTQDMRGTGVEQLGMPMANDNGMQRFAEMDQGTLPPHLYRHKTATAPLFKPESGRTYTFGAPVFRPDMDRFKVEVGNTQSGVSSTSQQRVGPGLALDPSIAARGGLHEMTRVLPSTDSYAYKLNNLPGVVTGAKFQGADQAPVVSFSVPKRRPNAFYTLRDRPMMPTGGGAFTGAQAREHFNPRDVAKGKVREMQSYTGNPSRGTEASMIRPSVVGLRSRDDCNLRDNDRNVASERQGAPSRSGYYAPVTQRGEPSAFAQQGGLNLGAQVPVWTAYGMNDSAKPTNRESTHQSWFAPGGRTNILADPKERVGAVTKIRSDLKWNRGNYAPNASGQQQYVLSPSYTRSNPNKIIQTGYRTRETDPAMVAGLKSNPLSVYRSKGTDGTGADVSNNRIPSFNCTTAPYDYSRVTSDVHQGTCYGSPVPHSLVASGAFPGNPGSANPQTPWPQPSDPTMQCGVSAKQLNF